MQQSALRLQFLNTCYELLQHSIEKHLVLLCSKEELTQALAHFSIRTANTRLLSETLSVSYLVFRVRNDG